MGIHTTTSSSDLLQQTIPRPHSLVGSDPTLGLQLPQTLPDGKRIRSHEFGLHGCYFIRKLASNLSEPQRSYALNAIDRAIQFWKGKRVPRCLPLRAPWILSPTWSSDLRKLLRQHIAQMRPHTVTFQTPSSAVVFTKNPSVKGSLCNHKLYATR